MEHSNVKDIRLPGLSFDSDTIPHNKKEKEDRVKFLSQKISEYSTELNLILGTYKQYARRSKPEYIRNMVEEVFGIPDITARHNSGTKALVRTIPIAHARHAARYLMSRFSELTNDEIAKVTGSVEHSVIRNSVVTAKELIQSDPEYRAKILQCIVRIRSTY